MHTLSCIAYAYSEAKNISYEDAVDIVNYAISECFGVLHGDSMYQSVEEVVLEVLDLGASWASLFTDASWL